MNVLYSKNAAKALLSIHERDTAKILEMVNSYAKTPKEFSVSSIPGASDGRKYLLCPPYYIVFKYTFFKGSFVLLVAEILTKEDYYYYTN